MIRRPKSIKRKLIILAVVLVVLIAGVVYLKGRSGMKQVAPGYPQYYNFAGEYVFTVPSEYSVDEQSVPGIQLVYSGVYTVRTVKDVYDVGGISVQPLTELKDQSGKEFKKFVEDEIIKDLKTDLDTDDIKVKYIKVGGKDASQITIKKNDKPLRFIYVKSGQHPVIMVANEESAPFKRIAETITDVEEVSLGKETKAIRSSIQAVIEQAKERKAAEIYSNSAEGFKTSSSQDQLSQAIQESSEYIDGDVTISGGSYDKNGTFTAAIRFVKLDQEDKRPSYGSLAVKKIDGSWKLEMLGLPSDKEES